MFITFLGIQIISFIKLCPLKLISGYEWLSTKFGISLLSDLVVFSIFFSYIPLVFHESTQLMSLKYLMYFLASTNTK